MKSACHIFHISFFDSFNDVVLDRPVGLRFSMEGISVECCLVMLCCSGLIATRLSVDEKTNEDRTQSFTDKSRRLSQTSHSTEQSVFSSECDRVDTSNHLDTDEDCKQSDTLCDTQVRVECDKQMFTCAVCDKKFTRLYNLKYHVLIHTDECPFVCKMCNKTFSRSSHLKDHMRIHTGERPFSCKFCAKTFTQSSNLKYHMRIHTGHMHSHTATERRFSCKFCNVKIINSRQLKRHMRIHASREGTREQEQPTHFQGHPGSGSYCRRGLSTKSRPLEFYPGLT